MTYIADTLIQILILMTLGLSLNLLLGYAGQVSMAHAAFYGIGAYTAALMTMSTVAVVESQSRGVATGLGLNHWLALVIAMAVTFVFALIISVPAALRVRGELLILFTLAFQLVVAQVMIAADKITGGPYGLAPIPPMSLLGFELDSPERLLPVFLALAAIVLIIVRRLGDSPYGRVLKGIREDQLAVSSLGKNVVVAILITFGITAAMAGAVGAFQAYYFQLIAPTSYTLNASILIVAAIVLGGAGNVFGTVIGAIILGSLKPLLETILGGEAILYQGLIYGLALVAMMIFRPQGILPEGAQVFRRKRAVYTSPKESLTSETSASTLGEQPAISSLAPPSEVGTSPSCAEVEETGRREVILEFAGLSKSFGGLQAVDNVSFGLEKGKITGLIGPNGAGKTTIYNLVTGAIQLDSGKVLLRGEDVTGKKPYELVHKGIARSFQDIRLFTRLSALQNVATAVGGQLGENAWALLVRPRRWRRVEGETLAKARESLRIVGMEDKADEIVGDLSFGDQKLVAIARLLATGCDVLLLDEPTSGVDPDSVEKVIDVVRSLRNLGRTICLIEHSVHLIGRLADRVVFLDQGRVLAEGTMSELTCQTELAEIYFGT